MATTTQRFKATAMPGIDPQDALNEEIERSVLAPDPATTGISTPIATTPGEVGPRVEEPMPVVSEMPVVAEDTRSAMQRYGTGNVPGASDLTWGDTSRLSGFNTAEWGPGGTEGYEDESTKNSFGKIASRYDPTAPNAVQAISNDPDFRRLFPMARLVEHPKGDQIDFGDGPVDVLINAREGGAGEAWAWQPGGGGAAQAAAGAAQGAAGGFAPPQGQIGGGSWLDQIIASLQAQANGQEDPAIAAQLQRIVFDQGPGGAADVLMP